MPSRIKDEVFKEIKEHELEGSPGWSITDYFKALVSDVDPEIREFIYDLDLLGYPTYTSCAGGPGHCTVEGGMGFVFLNQDLTPLEEREVKSLAKRHGLKVVSIKPWGDMTQIIFNPTGGKPFGH